MDWYGSSIAGVPFLLRNILTLQRAGIEDIALCIEADPEEADDLIRSVR
ncbi:MAG: hypothetical protein GWO19_22625, partial [Nitrospinaceae bacterium]|nr:hypothetical protein [Nitrospinaceae bacterium]